jgi:hypothetical protein
MSSIKIFKKKMLYWYPENMSKSYNWTTLVVTQFNKIVLSIINSLMNKYPQFILGVLALAKNGGEISWK